MADLEALLQRAEREGVISAEQGERLRVMSNAPSRELPAPVEAPRGFNFVTVAYGVGAMLVLYAAAWFLLDRWARLGATGVLVVALTYAAILGVLAWWFGKRRFRTAAALCVALAVSLTPLVTWSLLSLSGRWPSFADSSGRVYFQGTWQAWQWVVIELSTILAGLLVLRWRRIALVCYPIAVALWGLQYHLARIVRGESWDAHFDRWVLFTCGAVLLAIAERVERWQVRRGEGDGDFAQHFWLVGFLSFGIGYVAVWDGGGAWRHLLIVVALGTLALSLYLGRRLVMAFGMLGVFAYLSWLSNEVFKSLDIFPVVLGALGLVMIASTVWLQRRFPAIVARVHDSRREVHDLPWSPVLPLMLPLIAVVMLAASRAESAEERAQQDFRARLTLLQAHSHRVQRAEERARMEKEAREKGPRDPAAAIMVPPPR